MKNPKYGFLGTSMHAHTRGMRMHASSVRTYTHPETLTQKQETKQQFLATYHASNT